MSFANKMAPCCYMMLLSPTIVPLYDSLAQVTGEPTCNASVLSLPQVYRIDMENETLRKKLTFSKRNSINLYVL